MKRLLAATTNKGKLVEINAILDKYEILSLKQVNIDTDVEEDGETFEANAIKKAEAIYKETGIPTIADDSGIEIEEFCGWPGVQTARFLGEDKATNEFARERNMYILEKMAGLPKQRRKVKYVTCIAYSDERGTITKRGEIAGYVTEEPRGEKGFGFDEIFELESGKTLAQLTEEEKNFISSRKKALEEIKKVL